MDDEWEDVSDPDMIRDATWADPVDDLNSDQDYYKEDIEWLW